MIGAGIIARIGWDPSTEDNFYLVSFDVDRIDRMDMDAESDGVMSAVWLNDVVTDYRENDPVSGQPHRYGCSGCDGTAYGPVFGAAPDSDKKIMLAYGIYGDTNRTDNDHQVILQYDPSVFDAYGQPLCQEAPHHSGPTTSERRYFLYTGNTTYGIQNLEYDPFSRCWAVAVYAGTKEAFTNFPLFLIDGTVSPFERELIGRAGEKGQVLTLKRTGTMGNRGISGCWFMLGSTGLYSIGDGRFYVSEPLRKREEKEFASRVELYRFSFENADLFVKTTDE